MANGIGCEEVQEHAHIAVATVGVGFSMQGTWSCAVTDSVVPDVFCTFWSAPRDCSPAFIVDVIMV